MTHSKPRLVTIYGRIDRQAVAQLTKQIYETRDCSWATAKREAGRLYRAELAAFEEAEKSPIAIAS